MGDMTLGEAICLVTAKQAARISTPGKWRVWRDGGRVTHEILSLDTQNVKTIYPTHCFAYGWTTTIGRM